MKEMEEMEEIPSPSTHHLFTTYNTRRRKLEKGDRRREKLKQNCCLLCAFEKYYQEMGWEGEGIVSNVAGT